MKSKGNSGCWFVPRIPVSLLANSLLIVIYTTPLFRTYEYNSCFNMIFADNIERALCIYCHPAISIRKTIVTIDTLHFPHNTLISIRYTQSYEYTVPPYSLYSIGTSNIYMYLSKLPINRNCSKLISQFAFMLLLTSFVISYIFF